MQVDDAAYYVGLSTTTFLAQEAVGHFRATWLTGGRKVYLREHLDAYLDAKRDGGERTSEPASDLPDWQKALMADGQSDAAIR